jgi:hypothetical protein
MGIERILDPIEQPPTVHDHPAKRSKTALNNFLTLARNIVDDAGMHPHHLPTCIGDIDGTTPHWMVGVMPCLTRTRCVAGGHWLFSRGRRVNLNETLYFFGMSPPDINYKGIISPKQLQTLCGNLVVSAC